MIFAALQGNLKSRVFFELIFGMNRISTLVFTLFCAISSSAIAFELPVTESILNPRDAFVPTLINSDDVLTVEWKIATGYYLYRDKTEIFLHYQQQRTRLQPRFAEGEKILDEEFGEQTIYRLTTEMNLAPVLNAAGEMPTLEITFQGCKVGRLCYPPTTVTLPVPSK